MTIDKFGRHINKHIIKKHLQDKDVIRHLFKHPTVEEVVGMQITKTVAPTRTIFTLYSDGTINNGTIDSEDRYYKRSANSKVNTIYTNALYEGKVLNVKYVNPAIVSVKAEFLPHFTFQRSVETFHNGTL